MHYLSLFFFIFIFSTSDELIREVTWLRKDMVRVPLLLSNLEAGSASKRQYCRWGLSVPITQLIDTTCLICACHESPWTPMNVGPQKCCVHGASPLLYVTEMARENGHIHCTHLLCSRPFSIVPSHFTFKAQVKRCNC